MSFPTVAVFVIIKAILFNSFTEINGGKAETSPFQTYAIIPDVVDKVPASVAKVTFANNTALQIGQVLTPTQTKDPPMVEWTADKSGFYTLFMTDPDCQNSVDLQHREWQNWLVVNIPGNDVSKGDVLTEYVGAAPPSGTDFHRYVLMAYKQPEKLQFDEKQINNHTAAGRDHFSSMEFANKYKMGNPIAGNVFRAKFDNYVPTILKQLGM